MQQSGAAYFQTNLSKPRLAFEKNLAINQLPFQGPKLEITTIYKAYVRAM
jgi:hypothetical protein